MSTDRFQRVVTHLLRGRFIHRSTTPDLFDFLDEPGNRDEVDHFLGRLGLRVQATANNETWYAALRGLTETNRQAARETAAQVKRELRHWVGFLKLTMAALNEPAPVAGSLLHVHRLSKAIHDHLNLQETLRTLAQRLRSTTDSSLQKQLELVINWATREDQGLLELVDEERGIYRLTGKVDWVLDMILAFEEAIEQKPEVTASKAASAAQRIDSTGAA